MDLRYKKQSFIKTEQQLLSKMPTVRSHAVQSSIEERAIVTRQNNVFIFAALPSMMLSHHPSLKGEARRFSRRCSFHFFSMLSALLHV